MVPGGRFWVSLGNYPNSTPSLATNALFFGIGGSGSHVFGHVTPVPMGALGLPAPAGCEWAIGGLLTTMPMTYESGGGISWLRLPPFPLPNDPRIANVQFYTQNVALGTDPSGAFWWYPSPALHWRVGTGREVPATRIVASYDQGQPKSAGYVMQSVGMSLRFGY
jgi:hypothetical protein